MKINKSVVSRMKFAVVLLLCLLSTALFGNNDEHLMNASNALVRFQLSRAQSLLGKVDYSSLAKDRKKAFYFFILGKIHYYRMDFDRSIFFMKKGIVFKSLYREWFVYYLALMNYMRGDFSATTRLIKRYGRDVHDFKIIKSIRFIRKSCEGKR